MEFNLAFKGLRVVNVRERRQTGKIILVYIFVSIKLVQIYHDIVNDEYNLH
jgi:hypothetical protein